MSGFVRHAMAGLIFMCVILTYMLQIDLSVAILAMVNVTALSSEEIISNGTVGDYNETSVPPAVGVKEGTQRDGPFVWDPKTRSIILGSIFLGYAFTAKPGGWLAYRFGAKWILGLGILWTSIVTLMTPLIVYTDSHITFLLSLQVLEGLGEGVTFPCFHALFAQWVPPSERSRILGLIFAGRGIGTIIAFPFSASLCNTEMGWPLVFYVFGSLGIVWCGLWFVFGASSPATSRWISDKERQFINMSLEETVIKEHLICCKFPWLKLLKTPAMWALWMSQVAETVGFYTLMTLLPVFFKEVLHLDISKKIMYTVPYICFSTVAIVSGVVADFVLAKKYISVGLLRKIADGVGHLLPGLCLLLTTVVGCNASLAIFLMCMALGSTGLIGVGSFANNLDVAGRYAGVTFGISITLGCACGKAAPYVVAVITEGSTSMHEWRIVFGIAAGIYWSAALVFVLFSQGHTAKWALSEKKPKERNS